MLLNNRSLSPLGDGEPCPIVGCVFWDQPMQPGGKLQLLVQAWQSAALSTGMSIVTSL